MRKITDYECMFLGGISTHPELIYFFDDLERMHFASMYGYIIYDSVRKAELDDLQSYGIYKTLIEVKRKKGIDQEEFDFALGKFDLLSIDLTTRNIELSYREIKNINTKESLVVKINNLDIESLDLEELLKELDTITLEHAEKLDAGYKTDTLDKISHSGNMIKPCGVILGVKSIDDIVKIEKNTFTIIGARPFQGKTTFACKVAMENTVLKRVLFFSAEMTREQIAHKVRYYDNMQYNHKNLHLMYSPKLDINNMVRTIKKVEPDLIIIDQLNKIKDSGKTEYERFSNVSSRLKILSGELEIPVICLAQINRSAENKRPMLSNLKGSGSLEEEADVVLILHVEDIYRLNNTTSVYIDKNRTADTKLCHKDLIFNPDTNYYI